MGIVATNGEGVGKASFDLKYLDAQIANARVIGPYFAIYTPGKPLPEFDTSYPGLSDTPPEPGKIILKADAPSNYDAYFIVNMSYGYDEGYPNGASLKWGDNVTKTLMPAIYTVSECYQTGWNPPNIFIEDPTGDSYITGRFTVIVTVAPGETVTIRFANTPQ